MRSRTSSQPSGPAPDYTDIDARFTAHRRLILLLLAVGVAVNAMLFWRVFQPRAPLSPLVTVEEIRADGPTQLCPGDALAYHYSLRAKEAVVVEVSTTTLRTAPEVDHFGGVVEREVFPGPLALRHGEQWVVPDGALPGDYVRLVAVTVPSRVMQPAFGTLAFRVEECSE